MLPQVSIWVLHVLLLGLVLSPGLSGAPTPSEAIRELPPVAVDRAASDLIAHNVVQVSQQARNNKNNRKRLCSATFLPTKEAY
jgi:hypothetical protein